PSVHRACCVCSGRNLALNSQFSSRSPACRESWQNRTRARDGGHDRLWHRAQVVQWNTLMSGIGGGADEDWRHQEPSCEVGPLPISEINVLSFVPGGLHHPACDPGIMREYVPPLPRSMTGLSYVIVRAVPVNAGGVAASFPHGSPVHLKRRSASRVSPNATKRRSEPVACCASRAARETAARTAGTRLEPPVKKIVWISVGFSPASAMQVAAVRNS